MSSLKPLTSAEPKGRAITPGSIPGIRPGLMEHHDRQEGRHGGDRGDSGPFCHRPHAGKSQDFCRRPSRSMPIPVFCAKVGQPELGYGEVLWIVRIVLLICVVLHIVAATSSRVSTGGEADRLSTAARKDVETTLAAPAMRWGGVLLADLHRLPYLALHPRRGGLPARPISWTSRSIRTWLPASRSGLSPSFISWPWSRCAFISTMASGACCKRSVGTPARTPKKLRRLFAGHRHDCFPGLYLGSGRCDGGLAALRRERCSTPEFRQGPSKRSGTHAALR